MESFRVIAMDNYGVEKDGELPLNAGKIYEVTQVRDDFFKVKNPDGSSGWAPGSLLALIEKASADIEQTCKFCEKIIDGEYISSQDEAFHIDCYTCSQCHRMLTGRPFAVKSGKITCEDCSNEKRPRCAKCDEPLTSSYITALGKNWHPEHFVCAHCGKENKGTFHTFQGRAYCNDCFVKVVTAKCDSCGELITEQQRRFTVGDLTLHIDCFQCEFGGEKLDSSKPIKIKDRKIYCEEHYMEHVVPKCYGCKNPLLSQYVNVMDRNFHKECIKCNECDESLLESQPMLLDDRILCKAHCDEAVRLQRLAQDEESARKRLEEEAAAELIQEKLREDAEAEEKRLRLLEKEAERKRLEQQREEEEEERERVEKLREEEAEKEKRSREEAEAAGKERSRLASEDVERRRRQAAERRAAESVLKPTYTLPELHEEQEKLPSAFNRSRKEEFLAAEVFHATFEMDLDAFRCLPLWRQKQMKRRAGLM